MAVYRFDRTSQIQVAGLRSRQRRRQPEARLSLSPSPFTVFRPFLRCLGVYIYPKWIISEYSYLQCNSSAAAAFRPGFISSVLLKFLTFSLKSSHPFSDYLSIYRLVGEFVVRSITGGCAELSVGITGNALTGARANRRSSETRGGGERRGIDLIFFRAWGGVTVLLSIPLGIPSRPRRYHVPSGNLRRGLELREENKQSRGKCSSCFICFALSLFQLLPMRPIKPYNRHIFCSSMHPFRIQFKDQAHDSSESNCSEL
jgi:hypothetical protein